MNNIGLKLICIVVGGIISFASYAVDCSNIEQWQKTQVYKKNDTAKFEGVSYVAKWWSKGTDPKTVIATEKWPSWAELSCDSPLQEVISAENPEIQYIGRFDRSTNGVALAQWPGVKIKARFTGTSISVLLEDGGTDYLVYLDGKEHKVLVTTPGVNSYDIAKNLIGNSHDITIVRKSLGHSTLKFKGFKLDLHAQLLPLSPRSDRRIEFIGASWTVGYGNESSSRTCSSAQLREKTNTDKSFGSLVARHFNAEPYFHAWSGKGISRNYGYDGMESPDPLPFYYPFTLKDRADNWNFDKWIPHYIVIQLGGNDFSVSSEQHFHPTEEIFKRKYHKFLDMLYLHHPKVKIILASTRAGNETNYKETIVAEQIRDKGRGGQIFHVLINSGLGLSKLGCHWHPTVDDDKKIAGRIISQIEAIGQW